MTAAVPADFQLHGTYFVVAHIHYVLIGINVFGVLGGLYFWFPKMSGRMMSERLGYWGFATVFTGFNLAFLPMHLTGLLGMPRRIYTYPDGVGWNTLNLITTIGAFILAIGILLVIVNIVAAPEADAAAVSIIAINLAAIAVALLALAVSLRSVRRTRHDSFDRKGGIMQTGEGRTRFLSVWAVWISALFLLAIGANTVAVFWRGLCPG